MSSISFHRQRWFSLLRSILFGWRSNSIMLLYCYYSFHSFFRLCFLVVWLLLLKSWIGLLIWVHFDVIRHMVLDDLLCFYNVFMIVGNEWLHCDRMIDRMDRMIERSIEWILMKWILMKWNDWWIMIICSVWLYCWN